LKQSFESVGYENVIIGDENASSAGIGHDDLTAKAPERLD
jgi:hypothetical protein